MWNRQIETRLRMAACMSASWPPISWTRPSLDPSPDNTDDRTRCFSAHDVLQELTLSAGLPDIAPHLLERREKGGCSLEPAVAFVQHRPWKQTNTQRLVPKNTKVSEKCSNPTFTPL